MSILNVNILPCLSDNYSYIIHDKSFNKVIAIDPPVVKPITNFLKKFNLKLDFILCTHHHADHVDGNLVITGAAVFMHCNNSLQMICCIPHIFVSMILMYL